MSIRVMFMQSQSYFGADSKMHAQMMRYFDRSQVEVHVAGNPVPNPNPALTAYTKLKDIPDLHVRPTNFGPTIFGLSLQQKIRELARAPALPFSFLSMVQYIRRHNIQLLHGTEKPRDAFYGVLLGKLTGAKSIVHMHVGYADWLSPKVQWAIRNADGVIGVSKFVAETVVAAGVPQERVFHVVNGLDLANSKWHPGLDTTQIRREFNIAPDVPVIGIAARLFLWKGHSYLVDALALIKKQIPNVKLFIVGEDDPRSHPGNTSFRTELEEQVKRLNLEENVIFTGFRLDVPEIVSMFDVYVMPTWEEPCAVAFIEAMALGKPVVAWKSGGTPEMVVDGETGILTEPRNVPALADAVLKLLKDREMSRKFGEAARLRASTYLTPQRMCSDTLQIYHGLLAGTAPEASVAHAVKH